MEKKSYGNELLHKVLLDAMKDIDEVCRKNNIKYYIHAGTLLGAVVHKGFIPWDDDVDITMQIKDYEKFLKLFESEFKEKYFVQTYKTDYFHPDNRCKIRMNGTKLNVLGDGEERQKHNGIFLDIAPLYNVPDKKILRWIQKKLIKFIDLGIQVNLKIIKPTSIKAKLVLVPISKIGRIRLAKMLDFIMINMGNEKSKDLGTLSCTFDNPYMNLSGYENDIRPRKFYENTINLQFEDTQFMSIANYHEDLVMRYGNKYKEPYPEEKRVTKHGVESFEIEEYVKARLGL